MSDVFDCAKYIIKYGTDTNRNTYDGNMKLQKLLAFANLINIAENGHVLFDEPIRAFINGCVVENVRLEYKYNYTAFLDESLAYIPTMSHEERDALNMTISIFGKLTARELSEINHSFQFWKNAYKQSIQPNGFKDKDDAIVSYNDMLKEGDRMKATIEAYKSTLKKNVLTETVNGIDFYYDPDVIKMTDEIMNEIELFSRDAEDTAYSVYIDGGNLVIY